MAIKKVGVVFGGVIKAHRQRQSISQEELAHRASVDRTFVSRIERGLRQPTITTLIQLARALDVPSSQLISELESELSD